MKGLAVAAIVVVAFYSVMAQPQPTVCAPGLPCKVSTLTVTKTTGNSIVLKGDSGILFGDNTSMTTAASGSSDGGVIASSSLTTPRIPYVTGTTTIADDSHLTWSTSLDTIIVDGGIIVPGQVYIGAASSPPNSTMFGLLDTSASAGSSKLMMSLARGTQGSGGASATYGLPYIWIGGLEFNSAGANNGDIYSIGFGYHGAASVPSNPAVEMGYRVLSSSGSENGKFVVATRSGTSGVATERFSIQPNGNTIVGLASDGGSIDTSAGILQAFGHIAAEDGQGPVPSVPSEETTSAISVQYGRDAGTSGALTVIFPRAFSVTPESCICSVEDAAATLGCGMKAKSASQATFLLSVASGSDVIDWQCFGTR